MNIVKYIERVHENTDFIGTGTNEFDLKPG